MSRLPSQNPVLRLIQSLPRAVANEKREVIRAGMERIGKWEHYRQCVLRRGWKMGDTHIACAEVLTRHLGLTTRFFTGTDEDRERQIQHIIEGYHKQALSE